MDVTAKLAGFVTDLNYEAIPRKAVETAKIAVRDCLGVALAGSREEDARIAAEIARQESAQEETSVIGQGFKTSALNARARQRHRGARPRLRSQLYDDGSADRADRSGDLCPGRNARRERPSDDRSLRRRF